MMPAKFKMTELGPIPEDWEVKRIEEIADTSSGGTPSRTRQDFFQGTIRWFTTTELQDCSLYDSIEHISNEALNNSSAKIFPAGTILMAMYGATIGRLGILKNQAATNQACCAIFCGKKLLANFAYYYLYHLRPSIIEKGCGAGQPNISQDIVRSLLIALPPLPEQRRIAGVLSDVDELISALGKLIEKKRNIKTGAMQQLLTGKRRLPGFKGKWVEKRLGEVAEFSTSTIPTSSIDTEWYIGTENMLAERGGVAQNKESVPYQNIREYRAGDILISNIRPYLKKIWLTDRHGGCSTDVLVIRTVAQEICMPEYLAMSLSEDAFFDYVMANAVGTKMPRGDKKVIVDYELPLPPLPEQRAIAGVLSDMDAEIAALEAEKHKVESIKQGMMQELLTGRVRLMQ